MMLLLLLLYTLQLTRLYRLIGNQMYIKFIPITKLLRQKLVPFSLAPVQQLPSEVQQILQVNREFIFIVDAVPSFE